MTPRASDHDVVVVGAGFAGLYMIHRCRELGLDVHGLEAGGDVGGTWYWNQYPGARCDVESVDYSYSFSAELEQEWVWSERYAKQPEILRYLRHVADRFDLRRSIDFETRLEAAEFDETEHRWRLSLSHGRRMSARYCVLATGCLSAPTAKAIEGSSSFAGDLLQTSRWPSAGIDLTGRRVGVIGTGSSGVQAIPLIAETAEHVYVFQRTANYTMHARNRPLEPGELGHIKNTYGDRREQSRHSHSGLPVASSNRSALAVTPQEREEIFEAAWQRGGALSLTSTFNDLLVNLEANELAAKFVEEKIRAIVSDRVTAERLVPRGYPFATKRVCVGTDYYETFNRENVSLVDLRAEPLTGFAADGIRTAGRKYPLDAIVLAIGFDAITGALLAIDIVGRRGQRLVDKWKDGPRTYLGLATAGFPNLFFITGPGSPSVLSNMVVSIEQHVEWISECLARASEKGIDEIEAEREAEDAWTAHVSEVADGTLYPRAASWLMGANVPGKPRVFLPYVGGVGTYRAKCDEVVERGYAGFAVRASSWSGGGRAANEQRPWSGSVAAAPARG